MYIELTPLTKEEVFKGNIIVDREYDTQLQFKDINNINKDTNTKEGANFSVPNEIKEEDKDKKYVFESSYVNNNIEVKKAALLDNSYGFSFSTQVLLVLFIILSPHLLL